MLPLAPDSDIPAGREVPHLVASRPGVSDSFVLTVAIGGVRPRHQLSPGIIPSVSDRWNLKLAARLNIAFFQGLVERVITY